MFRLVAIITGFFSWWGRELAGLIPRWVRGLFVADRRILAVHMTEDGVLIRRWTGRRRKEVHRSKEGETPERARNAIRAAIKRHRPKDGELVLCIPEEKALFKEISLPALPEAELRRALYYQIDRQTPFAVAEVNFDYKVLKTDKSAGQVTVLLAVVSKKLVEQELQRFAEWAGKPDLVSVADAKGATMPSFDLMKGVEAKKERPSVARALNVAMTFALLGILSVIGYSTLQERREAAQAMHERMLEARKEAQSASQLQTEIENLRKDLTFFADRKRRQPMVAAILLELTRILPDHTWLSEFQFHDDEVRVSGHSSAASELIGLVDGSEMFVEPRFRSPVMQDPATGKERFNMTFRIAGGKREGA